MIRGCRIALGRPVAALACISFVIGVLLMPRYVPSTANAAGNGPTIALGAAGGLDVPVTATTASPDGYNGFTLHVASTPSAAVSLASISGSTTGGTLDGGGLYCTTHVPALNEVTYGCVPLNGQSSTSAGLLATMTLHASGNGCIKVRLIDLPPGDANAVVSDTYTVDQNTTTQQQNSVGAGTTRVIVGTGTLADCAGGAAVGGVAQKPDLPALATSDDRRSSGSVVILFVLVFATGLCVWHLRRRRAG